MIDFWRLGLVHGFRLVFILVLHVVEKDCILISPLFCVSSIKTIAYDKSFIWYSEDYFSGLYSNSNKTHTT